MKQQDTHVGRQSPPAARQPAFEPAADASLVQASCASAAAEAAVEPGTLNAPAEATRSGLSEDEAAQRLRHEGYNELAKPQRRTLWRILLEVIREPMFQLLIAAGIIYLVLGDAGEALILLGFVAITVTISVVQDKRSENVLETLRDLASPRALVIRGGERRRIPGREVVRGDIVVLAEGDRVPADAVLLSAGDMSVDESLLTGESVPVRKFAVAVPGQLMRPGGDDLPFVFAATMVTSGQGIAEVTAIGAATEIGKIGTVIGAIAQEPTLLHQQTRRLVRIFAIIGSTLSLAVLLLYGLSRGTWLQGTLAGITLAMSLLPEELPLILAVFMVMGAWRISRQRVLTRRPAAIETLGAATLLCSDKTGTLTQNRMSVAELEAEDRIWTAQQADLPEAFHRLLEFAILASERDPFDPMDRALQELGARHLLGTEHIHDRWVLAHEYGLSPAMLAMSHVWKAADDGRFVVAAKGAPEAIADLCHLGAQQTAQVREAAQRMAAAGMRVLGVAAASYRQPPAAAMPTGGFPDSQHDFDFAYIGLVGLADPLRPGVAAAVAECRSAGVRVAMITGDYPATALAIAAQAGIDTAGGVIGGEELQQLPDQELQRRAASVNVFARIMPEQKLRIVEAFKAAGEVVAMTGDGVNDAPSLKAAHIGIAMGARGTDVAREASSLVLLDDDFGSIVKAVRLGRRIYDNIRKALNFTLAVHVPIAGLSLIPLLMGLPILFTPVHIAFLELVIDPVCSIVFEAEPEEDDIMRRPPRARLAPLFSAALMAWSFLQGLLVLAATGGLYLYALGSGLAEGQARAATFIALVACNFSLVIANRSYGKSLRQALLKPNPALLWIFLAAGVLLAAALAIPALRGVFHFAVPPLPLVAAAIAMGGAMLVLLELTKALVDDALVPAAAKRA